MLSSVMHAHIDQLFAGMQVKLLPFRVTRNSDLWVDEEAVTTCARRSRASCRSAALRLGRAPRGRRGSPGRPRGSS